MKEFLKKNAIYLIGISALIITAFVFLSQINKGDESIFFSQNRSSFANFYFRLGTHIGEPYVYIIGVAALVFIRYRYAASIGILSILVLAFSETLKRIFQHTRPYTYFHETLQKPDAINLVLDYEQMNVGYTTSFPSGHTTSAFAFYGFLALITPARFAWLQVVWLLLACSVGLSRMYLIQHFLEDVTAGMVTGTLVAFITFSLQPMLSRTSWGDKSLKRS